MKKKYLVLVAVVLLCVILATLVACNYEKKYAEKLQDLGYDVRVSKGKEYAADYKGGYYEIYARKDDNYICIEVYDNKADAERAYSTLLSSKDEDIKSIYRDGSAVIYGTAQGVNDARS